MTETKQKTEPKTAREIRDKATDILMEWIKPIHARQIEEQYVGTYPASEESNELRVEEKKEK
ncbi:MAG: hypothetical protein WAV41_02305 [Microgenomates group bacterium]